MARLAAIACLALAVALLLAASAEARPLFAGLVTSTGRSLLDYYGGNNGYYGGGNNGYYGNNGYDHHDNGYYGHGNGYYGGGGGCAIAVPVAGCVVGRR